MDKIKHIILSTSVISLSLLTPQLVLAEVTSPNPTTVISDYALDIQNGQKDTANDPQTQQNQKDEKDNENVDTQEVNQDGVQEVGSKENIENDENQENSNNLNTDNQQSGNNQSGNQSAER